jgi:hypothetical protein
MSFISKEIREIEGGISFQSGLGRCRRHAPTMSGFPVVYKGDWCGDHKIDEEKV